MVTDVLSLAAVVLLVALFPVVLLAGVFALVDYLADDDKIDEIRRAEKEGRPVDFSGETTAGSPDGTEDLTPVTPPEELSADDVPTGAHKAGSVRFPSGEQGERTVNCSNCGRDNEANFDRCWNCQARL